MTEAGKGSRRRPAQVTDAEFGENWRRTFKAGLTEAIGPVGKVWELPPDGIDDLAEVEIEELRGKLEKRPKKRTEP
jgi:hypothetical protein